MAEHHMFEEHRKTWRGFTKLIVYSVAAIAIALALMALFLL